MSCLGGAERGVGLDQHSGHGFLFQEVDHGEGKVGGLGCLMADSIALLQFWRHSEPAEGALSYTRISIEMMPLIEIEIEIEIVIVYWA